MDKKIIWAGPQNNTQTDVKKAWFTANSGSHEKCFACVTKFDQVVHELARTARATVILHHSMADEVLSKLEHSTNLERVILLTDDDVNDWDLKTFQTFLKVEATCDAANTDEIKDSLKLVKTTTVPIHKDESPQFNFKEPEKDTRDDEQIVS